MLLESLIVCGYLGGIFGFFFIGVLLGNGNDNGEELFSLALASVFWPLSIPILIVIYAFIGSYKLAAFLRERGRM